MSEPSKSLSRNSYQLYVGIDISAITFDAAWQLADARPSSARTFQQTPSGLIQFHQQLLAIGRPPVNVLLNAKLLNRNTRVREPGDMAINPRDT